MKKLNLGKELSKNAQKKVVGGGIVVCQGIDWPWQQSYSSPNLSCANAVSYCAGQRGTVVYCS